MPDRLRVAVVARSVLGMHGIGGLERHVADLVRHVAALGVEVTLVSPPPRGAAPDLPAVLEPVPYVTFPGAGRRGTTVLDRVTAYPLFGWRAGRRAAELVRAGRVDIVHSLGASALGYAIATRRDRTVAAPLLVNPQGLEEFGATDPAHAGLKVLAYRPLQLAVRACAQAAGAVVATDTSLRAVVGHHLRVSDDRIVTLPNAIDVDRLDAATPPGAGAALRSRLGIAGNERLLLSVGRIEQNKGFHVVVEALSRLERQSAPWRWVLVGDGPWRARLADAVRTSSVASRIMMPGREEESTLHAWYDAADVFVHPTLYEGSSLVTLEAMAHGAPVVASRAGGLPDKVRPGQNGWLVPPGDATSLAQALREFLDAPERAAEFGRRSRAIAVGEFAWPAVAAATVNLYRALLASGPARGMTART